MSIDITTRLGQGSMDFAGFFEVLQTTPLSFWMDALPEQLSAKIDHANNGNLPRWIKALKELPNLKAEYMDLDSDTIRIGEATECSAADQERITAVLRGLHPWRKGPFEIFGTTIDAEWCSYMKWNRLKDHSQPLKNRLILDVGCGNGYYGWRMAGQGAKLVVGIDPNLLYLSQFQAIQHFTNQWNVGVLPLRMSELPDRANHFDTVFSMGVLYHRRSPLDHLIKLRSFLKTGGELVLESLVVEGADGEVLTPQESYGKMNNVWFIPSALTLESWLRRCGYSEVRLLDVSPTTSTEQRQTEWMQFESLANFLEPDNPNLTVEGYPAPQRAIFVAHNPV